MLFFRRYSYFFFNPVVFVNTVKNLTKMVASWFDKNLLFFEYNK